MAHALYEMTFFGYCVKTAYEKEEEEKHILDERARKIEDGSAEYVSFEEVMDDFKYVDKRTPKEKEHRRCKQITAKNKKIYKMLLSK